MATYWNRTCAKCHYKASGRSTSYNGKTVGPPLTKCPKCGNIQFIGSHREWIQLSTREKLSYGINQSFASTIFMLLGMTLGLCPIIQIESAVLKFIAVAIGLLIGLFVGYLYNIRTKSFINAYAYSLWRTDNAEYRKALSIPEQNLNNTDIPFYKPGPKAIEEINSIRQKEHKEAIYFSEFDAI